MGKCNRLSHSQANRYLDCPKSWEYHYRERLRPKTTSSALLFGSALDSAIEHYLLTGKKEASRAVMIASWSEAEINNIPESLPKSVKLTYSNTDYDGDLVEDEDWAVLKEEHGDDVLSKFNETKKQKGVVGYKFLKRRDKILYNHVNWFSMYRKGLLMFEKTVELLDENVEEVLSAQREISLQNEEGDSIIGYIDFIVRWKGYDKPIVFDLKTSSIIYERDSVKTSQQLSLYMHAVTEEFDTRLAGYLVMHKRIRKNRCKICTQCNYDGSGGRHKTCNNEIEGTRCNGEWDEVINPEVAYQIIIDEIPERMEELVIENMDSVNKSIDAGIYPRNFNSCMKPWGICSFYKQCQQDSMEDLIVLPEKEEK